MVGTVGEFFEGQSVLVTGGTGFLGKAVIEKLLRSCSKVESVYVIIRPKSGSKVPKRLEQLLESSLFDTIKEKNPDVLKKIIPIEGDISLPFLGINDADRKLLISKVTVVIHSAATVKFDENLIQSIELNVQGTRRIVRLCKDLDNLKALVHVSTAYSNCDRANINEVVYPPPNGAMALMESLTKETRGVDRLLKNDSKDILNVGRRPNTYTYTKALAEHILSTEAEGLPVCIVRPSIVTASWQEPVPGWIDNINGASGLIAGAGTGLLRVFLSDPSKVVNMIPIDVVVNLILCAAKETSLQERSNPLKVYNCCASGENPVRYSEFVKLGLEGLRTTSPFSSAMWYPSVVLTPKKFWYTVNDFLFQYLPALVVDAFLSTFTWTRLRMLNAYWKMKRASKSLEFFTVNEWIFSTDNVKQLFKSLSVEDQKCFYFNVGSINWTAYMKQYCLGVRRYIFKEKDSTVNSARRRVLLFYWIRAFFILLAVFAFGFKRSESIIRPLLLRKLNMF